MKLHVRAEAYCDGYSFASRTARFALRVGRWACSVAQVVAGIILFSVSARMGQLQWYSSFGTSTEFEFGTIERPTRQLHQVVSIVDERWAIVSILPFVRPKVRV